MNRFFSIIAVALLSLSGLTGCSKTPSELPDIPIPTNPTKKEAFSMRVMQFNILQATNEAAGHEWATVRRGPVVNMFNDIKPDIACLQECRKSQATNLAEDLPGYSQVLFPKDGVESNGGQRDVIMYMTRKFEVINWGKYWFSEDETVSGNRFNDSATTQKMTLWVNFKEKASGKEFYVFCTHFFANCDFESTRAKCVEISLNHVKSLGEKKTVFFCGDLNIDYNASNSTLLTPLASYMDNASRVAETADPAGTCTYNHWGSSKKTLDYIFVRNADVKTYKVVNSPDYGTAYISDHYPLYSDVVVYQ